MRLVDIALQALAFFGAWLGINAHELVYESILGGPSLFIWLRRRVGEFGPWWTDHISWFGGPREILVPTVSFLAWAVLTALIALPIFYALWSDRRRGIDGGRRARVRRVLSYLFEVSVRALLGVGAVGVAVIVYVFLALAGYDFGDRELTLILAASFAPFALLGLHRGAVVRPVLSA